MNTKKAIPQQNLSGNQSFVIRPLSEFIDHAALKERPHRHNFQEIIFIKKGEGKHLIDGKTFVIKDRTFYLIGKGQVHEFLEGKNLEGYLIRFVDNFLPPSGLSAQNSLNSTLLGSIVRSNVLEVPSPEISYYESIMDNLYYEFKENQLQYAKTQIIHLLLLTLLTKLERRVRSMSKEKITQAKDNETRIFHSFLLLIEENYKVQHSIHFYVAQLLCDKRKLAAVCKQFSKKTPKQILNERLMVEAKRMLSFTTSSSKEISFALGYEDPAYFSRFFKKYFGRSPREFQTGN